MADSNVKSKEKTDKIPVGSSNVSQEEDNENTFDANDISDTDEEDREETVKRKNTTTLQFDVPDEDEDIFTVKTKNVDVDNSPMIKDNEDKTSKKNKIITKAELAKKMLKKKVAVNKKIVFDDKGQELPEYARTKMSEFARQYENELDSGINIEMSKQMLREEDQFDKRRERERVKSKHREERIKLKAAKRTKANDKEDAEEDADNDEISEAESSEGPDMSWLPDPDKIYGKQQDTDEEDNESATEFEEDEKSKEDEESEGNEKSEEGEESEEENIVHR